MLVQRGSLYSGAYNQNSWLGRTSATTGTREIRIETDVASIYGDGAEIWTYDAGGGSTETSSSSGTHTHQVTIPNHTHQVTIPAHTHSITYGITDDTAHPQSITVSVNGVNKTNDLFGSATLAPTNAAIDVVADAGVLTGLLNNASGGLRQEHDITIACGSGQGRVEVTVEVYEITQTIAVV